MFVFGGFAHPAVILLMLQLFNTNILILQKEPVSEIKAFMSDRLCGLKSEILNQ